jgi:hypothetical protein
MHRRHVGKRPDTHTHTHKTFFIQGLCSGFNRDCDGTPPPSKICTAIMLMLMKKIIQVHGGVNSGNLNFIPNIMKIYDSAQEKCHLRQNETDNSSVKRIFL